jgi:beta-glucosidase
MGTAFPDGFLWGVATSAQQIEGAVVEGGRGESIWDRYASVAGNIKDGSDPSVACDHFHRWHEDVELMRALGVNAYRFSIAWPRVLPLGLGRVNVEGLDFYDALVDGLLAAGIRPFVTLNHWDVPQALQDQGGWTSRGTVDAFTAYADAVSRRLGDRVRHWVTHNEPWCIAHLGYEQGAHAPGHRSPREALRVAHHLLLSHGRAVEVLRRNAPGAQAGIVLLLSPVEAAADSPADRDAAREFDGGFNRWYLDPLFHGTYPADAVADRARRGHLDGAGLDFVFPGDMACITTPTDFLGVNYYSRTVVRAGPDGRPLAIRPVPDEQLTDMGWEVYPQGLHEILVRVRDEYAPAAIHVTENGAAFRDPPAAQGAIADTRRVEFLRAHAEAMRAAVADGVPLRGYFAWSLMDNFEWGEGVARRFGLHHVDYTTQRRTARASAHWYRDFIARGAIEDDAPQHHTRRRP